MRRILLTIAVLLTCLAVGPLSHGGDDRQTKAEVLMRRKLEHAQKVLEGLALNDLDKIAKHAEELLIISKKAEWNVMKTTDYAAYSNSFRRSAQTMIDKAKDKNLDGATLAYMDMTLTCVKCHKYTRETRMTRLDR